MSPSWRRQSSDPGWVWRLPHHIFHVHHETLVGPVVLEDLELPLAFSFCLLLIITLSQLEEEFLPTHPHLFLFKNPFPEGKGLT